MEEKSESETIDLIISLLASEKTYIRLSKLLSGFEKETGHSLQLFGHATIEQFLKSISNKIQVLLVEEEIYVKLDTEESANSEEDLTHAQNEVNKADDDANKVDDDVNNVGDDIKVDDGAKKVDDDVKKVGDDIKVDDGAKKVDDDVKKVGDDIKVDDGAKKVDEDVNKVDDDVNKMGDDIKVDDGAKKVDEDVNKVDDDVKKVGDDIKVDDGAKKVDEDVNKVDDDVNKVEDDENEEDDDENEEDDDESEEDDDENEEDDDESEEDDDDSEEDDDESEEDDDENKEDDDENKEDDPSSLNSATADPSSSAAKSDKGSKTKRTNKERKERTSERGNLTIDQVYNFEDAIAIDPQKTAFLRKERVPVGQPEYEPCIDNCLSCIILDESDIPTINLLDHVKVSDCIRVIVPEVRNPHRFILQLKKYQYELTTVMRRMQTLYNFYGERYALGDYKFAKNQVCAVLYNTNPQGREWYRAKIINFNTLNSTVLLVDYGIVTNVINTNIKYLDRDFGYLPMQAINGHLASIKPYRGKYWSEDCCKRFYISVFEEDLVAQVIRMDTTRRWLSVILSYYEAQDFLINENLVRGKFPIADCDFYEDEQFRPVVYDSISPKEFIQAEEVGKIRRLKSEYREREDFSIRGKGRGRRRNKALR